MLYIQTLFSMKVSFYTSRVVLNIIVVDYCEYNLVGVFGEVGIEKSIMYNEYSSYHSRRIRSEDGSGYSKAVYQRF